MVDPLRTSRRADGRPPRGLLVLRRPTLVRPRDDDPSHAEIIPGPRPWPAASGGPTQIGLTRKALLARRSAASYAALRMPLRSSKKPPTTPTAGSLPMNLAPRLPRGRSSKTSPSPPNSLLIRQTSRMPLRSPASLRLVAEPQLLGDVLARRDRVVVLEYLVRCDRPVGEYACDDRRTVGMRLDAVLAADRTDDHRLDGRAEGVLDRQPVGGRTADPGEARDDGGEPAEPLHPPVAALRQRQRRPLGMSGHLHLQQPVDRQDQALLGQVGLLLGGVLGEDAADAERVLGTERVEHGVDAELDPAEREDDGGIGDVGTVCHARQGRESAVQDGCRGNFGVSVAIRTRVRDSLVS